MLFPSVSMHDKSIQSPFAQSLSPRSLGRIVAVGIAGGLVGLVYLKALWLLEQVFWPGVAMSWRQALLLVGGGIWTAVLTRMLGDPGGVDLLVDNIHVLGGARDIRALRSLIPISLVGIAVGGASGPEAPLVQTTGSLGTWLATRQGLSQNDRRILTITGMAAGFTVLFGAPLGAAIFALEILHRRGLEYYEALLPAIIGSLCGFIIFAGATGLGLAPVWNFPMPGALPVIDFFWGAAAGVAAAVVAALFMLLHGRLRSLIKRLPAEARPILGGVALALLACISPFALTFGEAQLGSLLEMHPTLALLALAILAKFAGTMVTVATEWRGGFIIPLFFIGAALGRFLHLLFPSTNELVLMTAMMAGINTGVTKTPVGSALVVAEMAGLRLMPTTMVAAMISLLLTHRFGMIESQRSREGGDPGSSRVNAGVVMQPSASTARLSSESYAGQG